MITSLFTLSAKCIVCVQVYLASQRPLSMSAGGEGYGGIRVRMSSRQILVYSSGSPSKTLRHQLHSSCWQEERCCWLQPVWEARSPSVGSHTVGSTTQKQIWLLVAKQLIHVTSPCRACLTPVRGSLMQTTLHPLLPIPYPN